MASWAIGVDGALVAALSISGAEALSSRIGEPYLPQPEVKIGSRTTISSPASLLLWLNAFLINFF
jgi:hypothetical protein